MDEQITQVLDALEKAGLHTWELSEGIINVHSAPVTDGGSADAATYLYTVTVTKTP
jgi:hypothetical protein